MKIYVSRQFNGMYMWTALRPVRRRVGRSKHDDLYVPYRDPLGFRNMCFDSIALLLPGFKQLEPFEVKRVHLESVKWSMTEVSG